MAHIKLHRHWFHFDKETVIVNGDSDVSQRISSSLLKLQGDNNPKFTSNWDFSITNQSMKYHCVFSWVLCPVCSDSEVTIVMSQWSSVAPMDEFVHWLIVVSETWANPILQPQVNSGNHTRSICWQQTDIDCDQWCLPFPFMEGEEIVGWISSLETLLNP